MKGNGCLGVTLSSDDGPRACLDAVSGAVSDAVFDAVFDAVSDAVSILE